MMMSLEFVKLFPNHQNKIDKPLNYLYVYMYKITYINYESHHNLILSKTDKRIL